MEKPRSPTYRSWAAMKQRCNNPNASYYEYYGGRGISYEPRWEIFENFFADMGERPDGLTLDRKDGALGYSKENCRWASRAEQVRNRSCTKLSIEKAEEIRRLYRSGATKSALGERFGVTRIAIHGVLSGRNWN